MPNFTTGKNNNMKIQPKKFSVLVTVLLAVLLSVTLPGHSQVMNSTTKKKVSLGVGMYTDIWMKVPSTMDVRTINQGVQIYGTYNMPFGKSNFSFAVGLGISIHNLYWNYRFQENDKQEFQFVPINDTLSYKRSKLTLPYIEIPVEFRLKTKSKVTVSAGFNLGYMVYAHAKWVGDDYLFRTTNTLKTSFKGIKNLERFSYGPTLRVGYKWFNVSGYYALSHIFSKGDATQMTPISVGFILMPF